LRSFADEALLLEAWQHAEDGGYLCHEFGDLVLILPGVLQLLPHVW
jgi:hypothetical protein